MPAVGIVADIRGMKRLRTAATDHTEPDIFARTILIKPLDILLRIEQDHHLLVGFRHINPAPTADIERYFIQIMRQIKAGGGRYVGFPLGALPEIEVSNIGELVERC